VTDLRDEEIGWTLTRLPRPDGSIDMLALTAGQLYNAYANLAADRDAYRLVACEATCGGRPRVTVCEMSAVRYSCSRSINVHFFAISASIFAVSRSRNSAMVRCSPSGGNPTRVSRYAAESRF
jgi:hypothetical protein